MYLHHWRRFQAADFPPILLPIQGAQPALWSCTWDKASPLVNHKQWNIRVNKKSEHVNLNVWEALTRLCMAFLHWPSVLSSRSQDMFPRLGRSRQPSLPDSIISRNWSIHFITSFAIWKKALLASAYPECEMEVAPPGISNPFTPANTLNYILPIFSLKSQNINLFRTMMTSLKYSVKSSLSSMEMMTGTTWAPAASSHFT